MPQAAIHDFFKQIRLQDANQSGAVDQTLVADSTTDTLKITTHGGIVFENPDVATDSFGLNVDYSVNVPIGTTALTLTDIISNSTNVNFRGGPGVTVIRNSATELEIGLEEGYTAIKKFAIGADDSTLRFLDDGESALFLGSGGITTSSDLEGNITIDGSAFLQSESDPVFAAHTTSDIVAGTGFLKNDGAGNWSYDNSTYLTSYTETNDLTAAVTWTNVPDTNITQSSVTQHQAALSITESQISDLGSYITLTGLSVTAPATASGSGSIAYNNANGQFTYTPPDLSSYLTSYTETDPVFTAHTSSSITDGTGLLKNDGAGNWSYDNSTYLTSETSHADVVVDGDFATAGFMKTDGAGNYTVDNSTYLTSYTETNDLTAAVTWTNVPDTNITQSSVTQHQAALSITESQISDLQSYLTSYTETDPVVGAVTGIVKSDGAGNISAAVAGTDYLVTETLSLADFKAVVAASTDFADFQSRVAAL